MQYRQKTPPEPQCIGHPETTFWNCCYRVRQKLQKNAAKIAKNTLFEIPPFVMSPTGHYGEKFNIGA